MELLDLDVQFGMGGGAFASEGFDVGFGGSEWASIADVRATDPLVLEYGINGSEQTDRIADTGALTFSLDNSEANSNQTAGWYSPLSAIKRGGFNFDIPVRLVLTSANVNAGAPYYKFYGRLGNIVVVPGVREERVVHCTALDIFDDYARMPAPALAAQFNKRGDELVQSIIDALPADRQPQQTDIDQGLDTHPVAFDDLREEEMSAREALNSVCMSDYAKLYMVGSTTEPGGLLAYRNRHFASINPTVLFSFDNDMTRRGGLVMPGSRDDLVSKLQVFVHPTRVDAFTAPQLAAGLGTVLYSLETQSTLIQAGETNDTLFGPYRDPSNPGDRIGGKDMQQPVVTTDYTMNTAQDGTGSNVSASFTVTASYTGAGVRFTIVNNGSVAGYVTKLQSRGNGIYRVTAVIEKEIDAQYGTRLMQFDMPFMSDLNVGNDIATYLSQLLSQPLARAESVTFLANTSAGMMDAAINREPGDRISVTEDITGLDAQEFTINGVRLDFQTSGSGPLMWCTWFLEPISSQRFWILGQAGSSEFGLTTTFGF